MRKVQVKLIHDRHLGETCGKCDTFEAIYTVWYRGEGIGVYHACMYCAHDEQSHSGVEVDCRCKREEIYPTDLLQELDEKRAGAQIAQDILSRFRPHQ